MRVSADPDERTGPVRWAIRSESAGFRVAAVRRAGPRVRARLDGAGVTGLPTGEVKRAHFHVLGNRQPTTEQDAAANAAIGQAHRSQFDFGGLSATDPGDLHGAPIILVLERSTTDEIAHLRPVPHERHCP